MVGVETKDIQDLFAQQQVNENITLNNVEALISQYPAFNTAYLLKSYLLQKENQSLLNFQLPHLATHIKDRAILHSLLYENKLKIKSKDSKPTVKENIEVEAVKEQFEEVKATEEQRRREEELQQEKIAKQKRLELLKAEQEKLQAEREKKAIEIKPIQAKKFNVKKAVISNENSFLNWLKEQKASNKKEIVEPKAKEEVVESIPIDTSMQVEAEMHQEIKQSTDPLESFVSAQILRKKKKRKNSQKQVIVSETFAEILSLQQKYTEAIEVYRLLSLKYPQKSVYFATQIKKLEKYL